MTDIRPCIGPGNGLLPHGQMRLTAPASLAFAEADTYEKIVGTYAGNALRAFTVSEAGVLTYEGADETAVLFVGSSDLYADKQCEISYAVFKNGELVTGAETPVTVQLTSIVQNISIAFIVELDGDDYLEIFAKCNDATATLTANTLSIVCWGDHK